MIQGKLHLALDHPIHMINGTAKAGKTDKTWRSPGYIETSHTGRSALIILGLCIICSLVVFNRLKAPSASNKTSSTDRPNTTPPARARPNNSPMPPGDSAVSGVAAVAVNEDDLAFLRNKNLLIPVEGVTAEQLRDTFNQERSEGRIHQALDILASEGTPVLASANGKVKLYSSERGGTMIYVIDPSGPYVYYYAHLQRYADGLYEGKEVSRGEVIGFVGDTGNAGAGNFHLHFGIARVTAPGKWSGGEPINPFPLLTRR